MAPRMTVQCLVLVLVVMLCGGGATAQSQSGCTNALMGLSSCLSYVNGSTSTPASSCCSSLSSVVQSQPQCLCMLLNAAGMSSLGVTINQTLALQLPGACSVSTPPLSRCNAAASGPSASSPASPPTSSPAESSDDTPESQAPAKPSVPSIPAGTGSGSKTVPSTTGSTSGGTNIRAPLHLTAFVLFILSCASMAKKNLSFRLMTACC